MRMRLMALLVAIGLLSGCSSHDNSINVNDLPVDDPEFSMSELNKGDSIVSEHQSYTTYNNNSGSSVDGALAFTMEGDGIALGDEVTSNDPAYAFSGSGTYANDDCYNYVDHKSCVSFVTRDGIFTLYDVCSGDKYARVFDGNSFLFTLKTGQLVYVSPDGISIVFNDNYNIVSGSLDSSYCVITNLSYETYPTNCSYYKPPISKEAFYYFSSCLDGFYYLGSHFSGISNNTTVDKGVVYIDDKGFPTYASPNAMISTYTSVTGYHK